MNPWKIRKRTSSCFKRFIPKSIWEQKWLIANNLAAFSSKLHCYCVIRGGRKKAFINRKFNNKISFCREKKIHQQLLKRYLDEINKSKVLGVYSLNDQPLDKNQEIKFTKKS